MPKAFSAEQTPFNAVSISNLLVPGLSPFSQTRFDRKQNFVNCLVKNKNPCSADLLWLGDLEAVSKAYKNTIPIQWKERF